MSNKLTQLFLGAVIHNKKADSPDPSRGHLLWPVVPLTVLHKIADIGEEPETILGAWVEDSSTQHLVLEVTQCGRLLQADVRAVQLTRSHVRPSTQTHKVKVLIQRSIQSSGLFKALYTLLPWQTPSQLHWEAFSHMLQLMHEGCLYTYPPLSTARYSFIQLSELEQCKMKQNCPTSQHSIQTRFSYLRVWSSTPKHTRTNKKMKVLVYAVSCASHWQTCSTKPHFYLSGKYSAIPQIMQH